MVRRRCHLIVVCDASCDPKAELADPANAIRKVKLDLGIPITIKRVPFKAGADGDISVVKYATVGRIHYDAVDGPSAPVGRIVYIKPGLCGREPIDVFNYSQGSCEFLHESTGDQWFSESQFESYRQLGEYMVVKICQSTAPEMSVEDLVQDVEAYATGVPRGQQSTQPAAGSNEATVPLEGHLGLKESEADHTRTTRTDTAMNGQPASDSVRQE